MTEEYIGVKFETVFLNRVPVTAPGIQKLVFWGKKLALLGLTESYSFGAGGNLSFRTKNGYIITAASSDLANLKEDDFVEIRNCSIDNKEVTAIGKKEPSSETMLHCAIYEIRPDVNVIFHIHNDYIVEHCDELGLKCTANKQPYGTKELVDEVLKVIGDHDYIVMKEHGIISLGNTFEDAGQRIISVNEKIQEI